MRTALAGADLRLGVQSVPRHHSLLPRVFNGTLRKGDHVKFFNTGSEYDADEVGVLKLKMQPRQEIKAGDVGLYLFGHQDLG